MTIKNRIIRIIQENAHIPAPITERSNLYEDLGFDSLSFIAMLTEVEDAYELTFDLAEMEACLQVGQLIATVENKLREDHRGYN